MDRAMEAVLLLVTLLAFTEVRCKEFKVYWNVPSVVCKKFNISFDYIATKYGITQNTGDLFKGDKVTILYNPGLFPKVYNYTHNYSIPSQNLEGIWLVNGGIPQDADTALHFNEFLKVIDRDIPDKLYDGIVIIDMEQWGATWIQNFNSMEVNKILSVMRVQKKNPTWTKAQIEKQARLEYDRAAYRLLYTTLVYAQTLRPNAKWGYYQYPQCFNPPGVGYCSKATEADNNQLSLIWRRSNALYPSLYLNCKGTVEERALQISGMVKEAARVQAVVGAKSLNIPYIWYRYFGKSEFILNEDLENLIRVPKEDGADGVVVWGSYYDFNSKDKCLYFLKYMEESMGPIVGKYTLPYNVETNTTLEEEYYK